MINCFIPIQVEKRLLLCMLSSTDPDSTLYATLTCAGSTHTLCTQGCRWIHTKMVWFKCKTKSNKSVYFIHITMTSLSYIPSDNVAMTNQKRHISKYLHKKIRCMKDYYSPDRQVRAEDCVEKQMRGKCDDDMITVDTKDRKRKWGTHERRLMRMSSAQYTAQVL